MNNLESAPGEGPRDVREPILKRLKDWLRTRAEHRREEAANRWYERYVRTTPPSDPFEHTDPDPDDPAYNQRCTPVGRVVDANKK